ncbi:hypothetical protein PHLCEN_2v1401 [Hermanssonia centrifuga]|uniref:Protein root UVB sensitive/RUS domain-containing protein n=1 Tax=Hermanssonia centrifuga TaxID=98765 RepID=A0A2R6S3B2_9APHY|nr:hypothetical protein PHLCEN_2v1401 [Hermanssonia centrifuga]
MPIFDVGRAHRYLPYHGLQFVEAILGTLVSVLCNQALLVSVGVSAEGSIFGAVAVQWIIKDGAGELAKLFFIRKYSSFFDSHPKTFNLIGAANVLFGSGLQIASLIVPSTATYFLLCAAGGNVFKMIGGAFWFTTHIKFVRCFAQQGNTGDVAAKSESQASIGQLLGYAAGIGLLAVSHSAPYLYSIFALTVPAHLAVTAWMLRVATFELLTLPRLSHLADEFVGNREVVSLKQLEAEKKTGLFGEFYKRKENAYVSLTPRLEDIITTDSLKDRRIWDACMHAFDVRILLSSYLTK